MCDIILNTRGRSGNLLSNLHDNMQAVQLHTKLAKCRLIVRVENGREAGPDGSAPKPPPFVLGLISTNYPSFKVLNLVLPG